MNWLFFIPLALACNPWQDYNCVVSNTALSAAISGIPPEYYQDRGDVSWLPHETDLTIHKRLDNPTIESKFSILYGKVECSILASHGKGIISSFYLQSDDLDEIDIAEIFGENPFEYQTNFFIKGNTTTYDRGIYHPITNPLVEFNKYGVEWTPNTISWLFNDHIVRKVDRKNKYGIPKSPMVVKLSLWAGGDYGNHEGTIAWAGGLSDYKNMPYTMRVKDFYVSDYSSGRVYVYGNEEGEWRELESVGGEVGGRVAGSEEVAQFSFFKTDNSTAIVRDAIEMAAKNDFSDWQPMDWTENAIPPMYQLEFDDEIDAGDYIGEDQDQDQTYERRDESTGSENPIIKKIYFLITIVFIAFL